MKGRVEAQCPNGCNPFEAEVWTMIDLVQQPELKDRLLSGELNLLLCDQCHRHFYHEQMIVVHDPASELLAFVFPSFFESEKDKWAAKMREDYARIREADRAGRLDYEPVLFFGLEALRELMEREMTLGDETDIMRNLAGKLKLGLYRVKPSYARAQGIPALLPLADSGKDPRSGVVEGLRRLLGENAYLASYKSYLGRLEAKPGEPLPPAARA